MFKERKYTEPFKTILVADREYTVTQEDIPDLKLYGTRQRKWRTW